MNLSATLANALWTVSNLPSLAAFRRALQQPAQTQQRSLNRYLSLNGGSAYGRAFGMTSIRTHAEFDRRVPLIDYDDLEPWIDRIRQGETNVLTGEPVTRLVPTSGSSGARKLIPFTTGLQREFNRAVAPWVADLYRRHPDVRTGPAYWSVTPATPPAPERSSVPIGFDDDSAYLGGTRRKLVDALLAAPPELRLVTDVEAFRYLTLLCLLRTDLRLVSVWHPSFLSLLLDTLPAAWDDLLSDIRKGTCRFARDLPEEVLAALRLRPMPRREGELRRADPARPETIWPRLRVISCWCDAHAKFAARDLERRFPGTLVQPKGLLATEAVVTIPFGDARPVALRSHFFEFLDGKKRIHLLHELKAGETYEVVVTTAGGLWRYRMRDEVEVTGFAATTPTLRFLGRRGNVSDRVGEKISEAFAVRAIEEALAGDAALPRFVLLAPDQDPISARYTLYVEGPVREETVARLETALRRNPHYDWCRQLGQLGPLRLFQIATGGYETFVGRELARGKQLGQIKPCTFSAETGWSDLFEGVTTACAES